MKENLIIRPASESDINEIYNIEVKSFERPFTIENLRHEFRVKFSDFFVAEIDNRVAAYAIVWKVHDEIHLNKIAVKDENRRRGIGSAMVVHIINNVNPGYAKIIFIEVKERDTGARDFYKKLNFRETGIRKDYYFNDNAVLMEREISSK
ncbi:MAG: ribosomal protein S18-alanine N-acetyltransferase [Spirochaetes bacterium]|jgi:ribosomal-protein-alanine N-acetyltransferase|nr:ribosomal protein S18-alanine N-acetyltransferase [Spirochaetota bacterium]